MIGNLTLNSVVADDEIVDSLFKDGEPLKNLTVGMKNQMSYHKH